MGRDFKLRSSAGKYGAQSSRRWFSRFRGAALIAMCVLAPSLLVSACGQKNAFIPPPPPKVDLAVPLKQTVTRYLMATGNTAAVNSTTLVARVQGFIQAIKYNDGDFVKAGTVLFVIEQKPYQLALEQAEAGQSSAAAFYEADRGRLRSSTRSRREKHFQPGHARSGDGRKGRRGRKAEAVAGRYRAGQAQPQLH